MRKALRDNGLTLVLTLLFLISILNQSLVGLAEYNEDQREHGRAPITYMDYITSAHFGESVFENWESEFLQMALYVFLTAFLFQRGSAESKDPDKTENVDEDPERHASDPDAPYPVRAGGLLLKLYKYSLSLVLFLLFTFSFVLHLITSTNENCRKQSAHAEPCTTAVEHLESSTFWFESFQNWQSEFLSIAMVVVLSIFLRQKGSPESKPVHAPHEATGR
jgi:hypothetical protein